MGYPFNPVIRGQNSSQFASKLDYCTAGDAEADDSPLPEALSLKVDRQERPLPCPLLCARHVSAVPLHAPRLKRHGLAKQADDDDDDCVTVPSLYGICGG